MRDYGTTTCRLCGDDFTKSAPNQLYCQPTCRYKIIHCLFCYKPKRIEQSRNNVYCSLECRHDHMRKPHSEYVSELTVAHMGTITPLELYRGMDYTIRCKCLECGYEMERLEYTYIGVTSRGCTGCSGASSGETLVMQWLETQGIDYKREFTFADLRYKGPLRYDFALFKDGQLTMLIEYDGEQHYEPVEYFGGEDAYQQVVMRDAMKDAYAKRCKIPLLRIGYMDKPNINEILNNDVLERWGVNHVSTYESREEVLQI